jgi:predicted DNA-binding mobile mystery protein A
MAKLKRARVSRQRTRQLDAKLAEVNVPRQPRNGWAQSIREAVGMNKVQLAKRMGVSHASVNQLEANEVSGSITVSRLQRAAEALNCEFAYVFIPKSSLSEMVHEQALKRARQKLTRVNQSQALEASAIGSKELSDAIADLAREIEVQRAADIWND